MFHRVRSIRLGRALGAGALLLMAVVSSAQDFAPDSEPREKLRNAREVRQWLSSRAARMQVSAGPDPDTVYIGKSFQDHTAPDNYWNLYTGSYRPGINTPTNTMWDWDNTVGLQAPDSLQGWWPYQREYNSAGGLTLPDDQRPWWCLDDGNVGNYVIPAGSAAKRTFGVIGYWHDDPGRNAGSAVMWTPLAGARSAWCGMRQQGDLTVQDKVTKNYYSGDAVTMAQEQGAAGTIKRFPGYLNAMDQMLYRDIAVAPGQPLTVSFLYRTRMSTSIGTTAATRTGWFHGDPLAVAPGNFISSSAAGANAPQDSFMVYVGAPVNDAACVYSDGTTKAVYDKQRRWFSEVIKIFGPGANYYELFSRAGDDPADTLAATPAASITVPSALIDNILAGSPAGTVRLVFRVKTNRTFADSDRRNSGYTSFGRGAVQIDDVTIDRGAGAELIGDFETEQQGGVNAIDNRFPLPPGLAVTDVWRSTGKPAPTYMHVENLSGLTYNDLCGPPDSPARACNINSNVLTPGNHDVGEAIGDPRYAAWRETFVYCMSPTINMVGGPAGAKNSQGISSTIAAASDDIIVWYDMYAGASNLSFTGIAWLYGVQAYPSRQLVDGAKVWGDRRYPGFIIFNPEPQCFTDFEPFAGNGFPIPTSNPNGIPDSLRILMGVQQSCFRFNVTLGCNSSDGMYFDNVAVAFVDLPGVPGQASTGDAVTLGTVSSDIWQFVNDTFPANETAGLPGTSAFDTTTALIRTGLNNAQATANALRFDFPGDSSAIIAGNASVGVGDDPALAAIRLDLVFRILPGPGNYQVAAGRSMAPGGVPTGVLLQVPTNQAGVVAPGDASFWGQYIADPGAVSAGDHNGHTAWDPLTWNSARMDSTQLNVFPVGGTTPTGTGLVTNGWMTMYHESDPKFTTLGIDKFRCFVIDTTKAFTSSPTLNNASCAGLVPAWLSTVPRSRTGWDGLATTKEFTKIIPDGLLTPGSHVQYFYRKSHAVDPLLRYAMCPDTNFITPQTSEGSTDQHRWQQFSVLPDMWKKNAYGGSGVACMLYVDLNDRRGNEGRFVGVMDSIGLTSAAKRGAHNGWTAPATTNITSLDVRTNMSVAVSHKNSQPGTTWDMYGVKASESLTTSAGALGNRLANRANMGFAAGREAKQGPTPEMLRAYYRVVAILSGDLGSGVLGPFSNRSQNDIALLSDFLTEASGLPQPRGLFVQGDGFGQSEKQTGGIDPAHNLFLTDKLGVVFRNVSYQSISGNTNDCADLLTTAALTGATDAFGVGNACTWSNDVYQRNPAFPEAVVGANYEDVGINGPYASDVVKPATALRNWLAVTSGYDIEHLFTRYCETDYGRAAYYFYMLQHVFTSACVNLVGSGLTLDVPGSTYRGPQADFMRIGNSVQRQEPTFVELGLGRPDRVEVSLYDALGRRVRRLAEREFPAGRVTLQWDGRDDDGRTLARGVYFVRTRFARSGYESAGKVIVLR